MKDILLIVPHPRNQLTVGRSISPKKLVLDLLKLWNQRAILIQHVGPRQIWMYDLRKEEISYLEREMGEGRLNLWDLHIHDAAPFDLQCWSFITKFQGMISMVRGRGWNKFERKQYPLKI